MKLAKIILGVVVITLLGAIAFIATKGDDTDKFATTESNNDGFIDYRQGKRGDDPLYSEEIKKNAALTLETREKQIELEENFMGTLEKLQDDSKKTTDAALKQIQELTYRLEKVKEESLANKESAVDQVKQSMSDEIKTLTESVTSLSKALKENAEASEAKIKSLESYIENELANQIKSSEQLALNVPSLPPEEALDIQPVETQGAITYPYGANLSVDSNKNSGNFISNLTNPTSYFQDANSDRSQGPLPALGFADNKGENETVLEEEQPVEVETTVKIVKVEPKDQDGNKKKWDTVFPVYTLPPNTILADSTLITPIVGRVPSLGNNVEDPYFFKVQISGNNLAANGHSIPGVSKIIASGYSTGVREQSCARGYIDSLTFIFMDGRIVTHGKASGKGTSNGQALGYLADKWGKPCIRGQYINNAKDYLLSRGAAAFLEGAAAGLSQSQVSESTDANGNKQAILDGNVWQFIFGQGVSGSAQEVAQYVRERALNAVDIVYVEQGRNVQILLDAMIPIDYDSEARKVNYYSSPTTISIYD